MRARTTGPVGARSGRTEDQALEALLAYAPRYAPVVERAELKLKLPRSLDLSVVERVPGSATTAFGAPGAIAKRDAEQLTPAQRRRLMALMRAAWATFDAVVAGAPPGLRKGPRGGGRDRDKMVDHVLGSEVGYAASMRVKLRQPAYGDAGSVAAFREAIITCLEKPAPDARWPVRYAARRFAWHALDHAWEIEDRSEPAT